mmetsp:Transcript_8582/g.17379  ORF Transcript_8582/g.17379 Transcript_8582/m.17379 type:complete len:205 (-) Transcript_8582:131-745(-)
MKGTKCISTLTPAPSVTSDPCAWQDPNFNTSSSSVAVPSAAKSLLHREYLQPLDASTTASPSSRLWAWVISRPVNSWRQMNWMSKESPGWGMEHQSSWSQSTHICLTSITTSACGRFCCMYFGINMYWIFLMLSMSTKLTSHSPTGHARFERGLFKAFRQSFFTFSVKMPILVRKTLSALGGQLFLAMREVSTVLYFSMTRPSL